ncbi:MAG: hypothetical protein AB1648_14520 [Pseudomonadota bacterium]|jgi:hypothetical protein
MKYLFRHPLLVFGLGIAAGYLVHKYRREILATTAGFTEKGREFVLGSQQHDAAGSCEECED